MSNDRSSIECRKSFSELLQVHARLDELFLDHQLALLRPDVSTALDALEAYERELLAHMQDEEELMIPLYRERAEAPVGGTAEIFLGEHDKLRQFLFCSRKSWRSWKQSRISNPECCSYWIRNTFSSVCWCIMTTAKKDSLSAA